MCAIFGIIGKTDKALINKISSLQLFRGPDSQETYINEEKNFCLGNNRLAVIDKEGGKQPMFSQDKKSIVVFNGVIYNFKEIREYLKKKGISFSTDSDTEVVANSYMHWGKKMFNYFDGMWAISIYDEKKNEIILSRDYVGQKPLFYLKREGCIYFSSSLKSLSADKKNIFEIDRNNLKKFLIMSHLPAPHTLYKNIYQVKPGENITIDLKNLEIKKEKYWDIEDGSDYNIFFKKIEKKDFKEVFKNTTLKHTVADQTPAVLLSGGLDSFLVASQLVEKYSNLKSYSLGFANSSYDETEFIKKLDLKFEKNIFLQKKEDFLVDFEKISKYIDDPIGDSSLLPSFKIFSEIKKVTNVSIGGDGGDENFFGYITFKAYYLSIFLKKIFPNFIFKIISNIVDNLPDSKKYLSFSYKVKKFFSQISHKKKYINTLWLSSLTLRELNEYFKEDISLDELFPEIKNLFSKKLPDMKLAQLYYFKFYLPMVLSKIDKASMYNSVENRSPFLSKNVINFSLDIKIKENFSFFNSKRLIKKIFLSNIPKSVSKKKKHGFALPIADFFENDHLVEKYINKKFLYNEKFFFMKLSLAQKGNYDAQRYIWNELILNISIQNIFRENQ